MEWRIILKWILDKWVRFQRFTAVTMKNVFFYDMKPCDPCKNNGHTASHPRRRHSSLSPPWKFQILQNECVCPTKSIYDCSLIRNKLRAII
jgi:hypothetical protein